MSYLKRELAVVAVTSLAVAVAVASGCGNGIQENKAPQATITEPTGMNLEIKLPDRSGRQAPPVSTIIKSNGQADLEITKLELIDTPERLIYRGEELDTECSFDETVPLTNSGDGKCTDGQYCDDTSHVCHRATLPETPITLSPGNTKELAFFLSATEGEEVPCADPDDSVPDQYKEKYCGKLKITTNATTVDKEPFTKGTANLYFQLDKSRSGKIDVMPSDISFDDAEPGTSTEKTFSVVNNGKGPLRIDNIQVQDNSEILSVTPSRTPIEIGSQKSKDFTAELSLPADFDMNKLPIQDFINIESSAVNIDTSKPISVTIESGVGLGAAIELDKHAVSFKSGNTQTITIENVGTKKLIPTTLDFRSDTSGNYDVKYKGKSVNLNLQNQGGIDPGESAKLELTFTGNQDRGIGEMIINHNDKSVFEQSSVMLLGKKDGGYAEILPESVNFHFGNNAKRKVVIRNRGTGDLTVNKEWQTANNDPPAAFTFSGVKNKMNGGTTIKAGDFVVAEVEALSPKKPMSGKPVFHTIKFPSDTLGDPVALNINVTEGDSSSLVPKISPEFEGKSIEMGQVARFTSMGSQGNSGTNDDMWFVLDRPMGSSFYSTTNGAKFAVRPDATGKYKIGIIMLDGSSEAQKTFDLTVKEASN